MSPLGACLPPYKVRAPLSFRLLGRGATGAPSLQAAGFWNNPTLHLMHGETEAQNITWPVASESGFKLRTVESQPTRCPATHETVLLAMTV